jgi:putative dimethyl sulfoxide reductase chaperone
MAQVSLSIAHIDPTVRSNLYKLLSLAFRYPTPDVFKTFQNGEFLVKLWNCISLLPHVKPIMTGYIEPSRRLQSNLEELTFIDFKARLVQTFSIHLHKPVYSHHGELYRKDIRTAIRHDISEYFRYSGLLVDRGEGKYKLSDYLCAQLEFLCFLTLKEAEARINRDYKLITAQVMAQKDFLERHIIPWVPKFCSLLQDSISLPFYGLVARMTSIFIACEFEFVISNLRNLYKDL